MTGGSSQSRIGTREYPLFESRAFVDTLLKQDGGIALWLGLPPKESDAAVRQSSRKEERLVLRMFLFLIAFTAVFERPAQAYIDPGAGSMVLQVLLAAFVGALFQIRRILGFVRGKPGAKDQ